MAKKAFYTEKDIEDLAARGVSTLEVSDDVYLTDLAREKAERLGVVLVREHETPSSAPIRPYLSSDAAPAPVVSQREAQTATRDEMYERVRTEVLNRLGERYDPALLDNIIRRVLDNL